MSARRFNVERGKTALAVTAFAAMLLVVALYQLSEWLN